jgi:hypothetical protein
MGEYPIEAVTMLIGSPLPLSRIARFTPAGECCKQAAKTTKLKLKI